MKSVPGHGLTLAPIGRIRIVRGQQEKELGLQRIGVLKLVDEDVREALLKPAADARRRLTRSRALRSRSRKSSLPVRAFSAS